MIDDHKKFKKECDLEISKQGKDKQFNSLTNKWIKKSFENKYPYHFEWFGRPIIQYPQDIMAIQQLLWQIKPDLVIETGIARGGSLIFISSILELISLSGVNKKSKVIGIDIDFRKHNEQKVKNHPLSRKIQILKGSSTDMKIFKKVKKIAKNYKKIMVLLDSNHSHKHVLEELKLYAPLVTKNSYCVVFDTIINYLPNKFHKFRPWTNKNNPKTATDEFLKLVKENKLKNSQNKNIKFFIDKKINNLLMISCVPNGFLKRK